MAPQRLVCIQINLHIKSLPHLRQIQRMQTAHDNIRFRKHSFLGSKSARIVIVIHPLHRVITAQHSQIFRLSVQVIGLGIQMRHFIPIIIAPFPLVVAISFNI